MYFENVCKTASEYVHAEEETRFEPVKREMDDILNGGNKTRFVVAPGNGQSTFVWELCRQWLTLESLKRFSLVVLLRMREVGVQTATHITDLLYHSITQSCAGTWGRRWRAEMGRVCCLSLTALMSSQLSFVRNLW